MLRSLRQRFRNACFVFLSALAMASAADRATAWELPIGVEPSSVLVGYLYNSDAFTGTPLLTRLIFQAQEITLADVDLSGNLLIPDGKVFLPGTTANALIAAGYTAAVSLQQSNPSTTNDEAIAAMDAEITRQLGTRVVVPGTYSTDALLYVDFTAANQAAVASRPDDAFLIGIMVPPRPVLVGQDVLDWQVETAVSFGGTYFGLQPDDPGLATALAGIPTTYNPTAGSILAPDAPTGLEAKVGDGEVSVAFTAPTNTGGSAITDYEYQLDGGSWVSASTTTSPVVITGLTNGTSYSIALRAVNAAGSGAASQAVSATPITTADAPTGLEATVGDGEVSVAFTAPTNTGGSAITDYEYQLDGGSWVSASTTTSPVVITGLTNGTSYSIALRAVNAAGSGAASASIVVDTPSPKAAFANVQDAVQEAIQDEAVRGLQSTVVANQRMVREARQRLIVRQASEDDDTAQVNVPFDVNGNLDASGTTISTKGTFFGAQSVGTGAQRLLFGDFDLQRDGETGSSTATMTGRMSWEQMTSERTLLGYFVGGELAQSNIAGAFDGNQNRVAMTVGGYAVHELAKNTYVDGFVTLGAGRNNLEMANEVLALESDYTTRSVTFGGALSSVIEQFGYEIWPELSFSYGRTWIGDVGFTGRAYGLVDNTLSLDAGSVTLANIMFRPEFRVPLDGLASTESLQLFTFAPRLICEQIKATSTKGSCGGGAEIGITGKSSDGRSTYSANIAADELGNRSNSMVQLKLEHRF